MGYQNSDEVSDYVINSIECYDDWMLFACGNQMIATANVHLCNWTCATAFGLRLDVWIAAYPEGTS